MDRRSRLPMFGSSRHKSAPPSGLSKEQKKRSSLSPSTGAAISDEQWQPHLQSPPEHPTPAEHPGRVSVRDSPTRGATAAKSSKLVRPTTSTHHHKNAAHVARHPSPASSHLQASPATGIPAMPGPSKSGQQQQHQQGHSAQGAASKHGGVVHGMKRNKISQAVDAVRGVLGVTTNISDIRHSEGTVHGGLHGPPYRGHVGKTGQQKRPTTSRRDHRGIKSQHSKELYCEFVTPSPPPTSTSPPPLPSPCDIDILTSLPQPAKRPMKMPMSTFKSNTETSSDCVRSTGGESRSQLDFDSSFRWTKNPLAATYYQHQVPTPPMSPVYMLYDTSPEHQYDTIPDEDSCSSIDGLSARDYCYSPTAPIKQRCLSPTSLTASTRSRPSCGIRMAEMRAATKRLQSPPLEGDLPPGGDDLSVQSHPCMDYSRVSVSSQRYTSQRSMPMGDGRHDQVSLLAAQYTRHCADDHLYQSPMHQADRATHVSEQRGKHVRLDENAYTIPNSSVAEPTYVRYVGHGHKKPEASHHIPTRELPQKAAKSQNVQSKVKNVSSTKQQIKSTVKTKSSQVVTTGTTSTQTEQIKRDFKKSDSNVKGASSTAKPTAHKKLRAPSKVQKSVASAKTRDVKAKTSNVKTSGVKPADKKPRAQSDSSEVKPVEAVKNTRCETSKPPPNDKEESMDSSASMKDSFMSTSFSSCSPQSSESEDNGSRSSSLNNLMDSSIESSDLERAYLPSHMQPLIDLDSMDISDIIDGRSAAVETVSLPCNSRLKMPVPRVPANQNAQAKPKTTEKAKNTRPESIVSKVEKRTAGGKKQNASTTTGGRPSSPRVVQQSYRYGARVRNKSGDSSTEASDKSPVCNIPCTKNKQQNRDLSTRVQSPSSERKPGSKKSLESGLHLQRPASRESSCIKSPTNSRNAKMRSTANIPPARTTVSNKPIAGKLQMASQTKKPASEKSQLQRLSLQPRKLNPPPNVKPRHNSDSADCYQRKHSPNENSSSTSSTPSSVTGSPLSNESCTSPLSPFSGSPSDGNDGAGGGAGGAGCGGGGAGSSSSHAGGSSSQSAGGQQSSSDKSQHSNNQQQNEGRRRSTSAAAACSEKVAKFLNRLEQLEAEDSKKGILPESRLRRPAVMSKFGVALNKSVYTRSYSTPCTQHKQDNATSNRSLMSMSYEAEQGTSGKTSEQSEEKVVEVSISKNTQKTYLDLNVHNDYTMKESDHNSSTGSVCGAGTHVPSEEQLDVPKVGTNHEDICEDMEQLSIQETAKSAEDDHPFDLTENSSTCKIADYRSSDDCEDIDEEDDGQNVSKATESITIDLPCRTDAQTIAPGTNNQYSPITDKRQQLAEMLQEKLQLDKSNEADCKQEFQEHKAVFVVGSNGGDSYEQLCEKSLEAISSSPAKSCDLFDGVSSGDETNEVEAKDAFGSVSDSGEAYGAKLKSASSPTLQQRFGTKRMEEYVSTFMSQECSLKRTEATLSLNVPDVDGARDSHISTSGPVLKDTAVSETSLHTCLLDSESSQEERLEDLAHNMVLAYPNLKDCQLLSGTDDAESSEAESFVCNFNMNSSSNNLALCQELDMTLSNSSLTERNASLQQRSDCDTNENSITEIIDNCIDCKDTSVTDLNALNTTKTAISVQPTVCVKAMRTSDAAEDDADTETLKQSESCLTLCECRSDSSGFTSLKDDASVISEDMISNCSSNISLHSSSLTRTAGGPGAASSGGGSEGTKSSSGGSSSSRGAPASRLRAPRAGLGTPRGLKPPTPVRRLPPPSSVTRSSALSPDHVSRKPGAGLPTVDEMGGMAMAVSRGDEGYFTMQGQTDKKCTSPQQA